MDRKYLPIVKMAQMLGYQIVYIDNTFFTALEFYPADENDHFHTVVGMDVTTLFENHYNVIIQDVHLQSKMSDMLSQIQKNPSETQKFSRDTSFRWFTSIGKRQN